MKDIIQKLCNAPGVSGFEKDASKVALELLNPLVDKAYIDKHGNVIGYKYSKNKNAKTIMLDAHIDQIGFIVKEITDDGYLRFATIGGVDPRMLLGTEVLVLAKTSLRGIISCMPPHLTTDRSKSTPVSEMLIDIGYQTKERALEFVKVGTPIIYADEAYQISKDSITSKALDDRAGIASILHTLELIKDCELDVNVVAIFSCTEEVSGVGSMVATFDINPDFAIVVDVTHAKTPDASSIGTFDMGQITIAKGPNLHKKLTNDLIMCAKAYDIPFSLEIEERGTGTNANHIQVLRSGIPVALLGIPLKYMHTQIETIKISDAILVSKLMAMYIKNYKEDRNNA